MKVSHARHNTTGHLPQPWRETASESVSLIDRPTEGHILTGNQVLESHQG